MSELNNEQPAEPNQRAFPAPQVQALPIRADPDQYADPARPAPDQADAGTLPPASAEPLTIDPSPNGAFASDQVAEQVYGEGEPGVGSSLQRYPRQRSPQFDSEAKRREEVRTNAREQRAGFDRIAAQGTASREAGSLAQPIRIGLWGATSSGKTTFLAALGLAVGQNNNAVGKWRVVPENEVSEEVLNNLQYKLISSKFPEATLLDSMTRLSWNFLGDISGSKFAPRKIWRRGPVESRFRLELVDVSGEAFRHVPDRNVPPHIATEVVDNLANSQGVIYLFDPTTEREELNSAEYMGRVLIALSTRLKHKSKDHYLPQQLSVCITKFDHPDVFQQARRKQLVDEGPDGMPRVLDHNAERFFDMLCTGRFWDHDDRPHIGAQFVRNQFRAHFHEKRTRYYVVSSIGLLRRSVSTDDGQDPANEVNPDDFMNVRLTPNNEYVIRGPIEPINVLEPLVSLQQRVSGNRRRNV